MQLRIISSFYQTILKENNIDNILALKEDRPLEENITGHYNYEYELVDYINKKGIFGIAAACY